MKSVGIFILLSFTPLIISIIYTILRNYRQDYLITHISYKDDKIANGRTFRQQIGFFNRKISISDLDKLEFELMKEYDLDSCVITNVIKLKENFFNKRKKEFSTEKEIENLLNEHRPGPRLMK